MRSVFSVEYKDLDHTDNICSVDWWGKERGGWIRTWKSTTGSEWHEDGKLDDLAYKAILEKFRLVKLGSGDLTIEKVQLMSPAALAKYRAKNGLPAMDIFTDATAIDPGRAEEYK
ncbi:MAG: hypothetical protein HYT20_02220 [Candidatus Nealsonbacteria bacterium]|nr:hypothetical protein [Candidatus Nealsonbacteria bacterium]